MEYLHERIFLDLSIFEITMWTNFDFFTMSNDFFIGFMSSLIPSKYFGRDSLGSNIRAQRLQMHCNNWTV
ncbi:hypothetical protein DERP_007706 [Dermatophagoides pteronyssinus]|uniref:Uncharacterized protein n=1 Tax=Dermatophagoides pteronyssinus TaxID=6956 RepID=A0ABQ8JKH4_DERPT|nr:hypothetical protein DERP_007706 [Dermatophagoides pteronyssinus]